MVASTRCNQRGAKCHRNVAFTKIHDPKIPRAFCSNYTSRLGPNFVPFHCTIVYDEACYFILKTRRLRETSL